ncbi:MAG: hypothetical protein KF799_14110 [Bdellovibrionales bacterium]|nr:hypothetical protein [Bdellovibrionales bacterium]
MRFVLGIFSLCSALAHADGLAGAQGVQVVSFRSNGCAQDSTKSTVFSSGRFPALTVNSRIESVRDASKGDDEIRFRLYGWVEEMTDFREADVLIKGSVDTLNKFRSDPNISNRYVRITTDVRCASVAALVDSVDVVYGWRQADPSLMSDTSQPATKAIP